MVTVEDVRSLAGSLPRSTEVVVRGRLNFLDTADHSSRAELAALYLGSSA